MEVVVIGGTGFLPGFELAGVRTTVLASKSDVLDRIKEHKDAGLIILDESLTVELPFTKREEIETSVKPIIISLSKDGSAQQARLKRAIINTLGVDLLK